MDSDDKERHMSENMTGINESMSISYCEDVATDDMDIREDIADHGIKGALMKIHAADLLIRIVDKYMEETPSPVIRDNRRTLIILYDGMIDKALKYYKAYVDDGEKNGFSNAFKAFMKHGVITKKRLIEAHIALAELTEDKKRYAY
jgi:DNA primase catalytic subunit